MVRLAKSAYKVGWLAALSIELAAAVAMLDSRHDTPWNYHQDPQSRNQYIFGSINGHNVVITFLPDGVYGTTSATRVAQDFQRDFPDLVYRFTVGIAGGAPSAKNDVKLGDVVVSRPLAGSPGIIQYDLGKALEDGVFVPTGCLPRPPDNILRALPLVRQWPEEMLNAVVFQVLADVFQRDARFRPPPSDDNLFASNYHHQGRESDPCVLSCDPSHHVSRAPRASWLDIKKEHGVTLDYLRWGHVDNDICTDTQPPRIHFGTIASGNTLMRDGEARTKIQTQTGALCFEMEAAGIMDAWPCLVVRGICDYSDSHKNKVWQSYAAGTAAAFTKFLLMSISHKNERIPPPSYLGSIRPVRPDPNRTFSQEDQEEETSSSHTDPRLPTTEIINRNGSRVRIIGEINTNGGALFNGGQRFAAQNIELNSGGSGGSTFNGDQEFNSSGNLRIG
ncbi:hypothetical protein TWF281_004483 [Arthrobotrys megalospora]